MGEGEFLTGLFWGLVVIFVGVVTSISGDDVVRTFVTTGGGDMDVDVEGKVSVGLASVSNGATLRVFGGVCFGVTTFVLIGGNIVLVLGFRHPCFLKTPRRVFSSLVKHPRTVQQD